MSAKVLSLQVLRSLLQPKTLREPLAFSLVEAGLPQGGVVEISGHGKTETAVRFLAEHSHFQVAWIEKSFSLNPAALTAWDLNLEQILFIESGFESLWTTLQIIKSNAFHAVVLYHENFKIPELRKLQLACEKSGCVLLWLSPQSNSYLWPVTLRLQAYRDEGDLKVETLGRKG